jgi:hypothetical protein
MLLFSFVGLLLLRLEACKLLELLFQLPPRKPRDEPARFSRTPSRSVAFRSAKVAHLSRSERRRSTARQGPSGEVHNFAHDRHGSPTRGRFR